MNMNIPVWYSKRLQMKIEPKNSGADAPEFFLWINRLSSLLPS